MMASVHFEYVAEMSAWNKILGKILDRDVHLQYTSPQDSTKVLEYTCTCTLFVAHGFS